MWGLAARRLTTRASLMRPRPPQIEERCTALAAASALCSRVDEELGKARAAVVADAAAGDRCKEAVARLAALRDKAERAVRLRQEEEEAHSLSNQTAFFTASR